MLDIAGTYRSIGTEPCSGPMASLRKNTVQELHDWIGKDPLESQPNLFICVDDVHLRLTFASKLRHWRIYIPIYVQLNIVLFLFIVCVTLNSMCVEVAIAFCILSANAPARDPVLMIFWIKPMILSIRVGAKMYTIFGSTEVVSDDACPNAQHQF